MRCRLFTAILFIGLLLISAISQAQEKNNALPDSVIIQNHLDEAFRLIYSDSDSAYMLSLEAIKRADELKYYKLSAQGLMNTH